MGRDIGGASYIDAPILRDENTDQDLLCDDERLYYLNGANFNVTALIDTAGDAVERCLYAPYGKLTIYDGTWSSTRSTSSFANKVLYAGREFDAATGLYHYRNRYYDPDLGSSSSRDPIGYGDGENLYQYVHNMPLVLQDPTGTIGIEVGQIGGSDFKDEYEKQGDCGGAVGVQFNIWLDRPNKFAGWLVQKVTFKCKVVNDCYDCPLSGNLSPDVEVVFFEAKRVPASEANQLYGVLDESGGQCLNNSCGLKYKKAEAKFFGDRVTGDLAKLWTRGGKDLGSGDCTVNPGANALWIEGKHDPKWWTRNSIGRVGTRSTLIAWTCCECFPIAPGEDQVCKISAKAEPKPVKH